MIENKDYLNEAVHCHLNAGGPNKAEGRFMRVSKPRTCIQAWEEENRTPRKRLDSSRKRWTPGLAGR